MRRVATALACLSLLVLVSASGERARADEPYPSKPIRLVLPQPAGGKTDITQVSYRGTAPAMTDIAAGVVDVMFTGPPSAMALAAGGKGKMLAIASPSRSSLMPQVPTMREAGVPGYELSGWFGLLAPAKTPQHVVDRLASEVKSAVADGKLKDRLGEQGLDVVGSSSEEMLAVMTADTKKWSEVIAATGAKVPQ